MICSINSCQEKPIWLQLVAISSNENMWFVNYYPWLQFDPIKVERSIQKVQNQFVYCLFDYPSFPWKPIPTLIESVHLEEFFLESQRVLAFCSKQKTMLNNMEDEIIGCLSMEFEVMQVDLNMLECVIIMIIWILIQFLGNGLLLGLIQYDRLGGDPLKRRICDQVSNFSILSVLDNNCT